MSKKAQDVARNSGAQVYWMDAAASQKQIESDRATMKVINDLVK